MMRSEGAKTSGGRLGAEIFNAIPAGRRGKDRDPFLKLPAAAPRGNTVMLSAAEHGQREKDLLHGRNWHCKILQY